MPDAADLDRLEQRLIARAGGFLRNPVRRPRVTCTTCMTPTADYVRCHSCQRHLSAHGRDLADAVGVLTYAVGGEQAAYMMRGYKATRPVNEHLAVVSMLTWLATGLHGGCCGTVAGLPVTHWATVPSLPPKPGEHPLHRIVGAYPPAEFEAALVGLPDVPSPRDAAHDHFRARDLPREAHVLLVEDTWTQGGHAQSAALALRRAGARRISILAIARWINREFGGNAAFVDQLRSDFDPRRCPWTGGECPGN
ncbi:MAG: hypothetical protein HOV83_22645 [Catenulispora sp.]|nr:hypothetical protein [Catenulispora sp.]